MGTRSGKHRRKRWFDPSTADRDRIKPEEIKKTSSYQGHAAANSALSSMKPEELKRIGASAPTYGNESTDWPKIVDAVSRINRKVFP